MELLKKYNSKKLLKASSLIESVIAMTIISVCILISLNVFSTVLTNENSVIKHKIKIEQHNILNDIEVSNAYEGETYNFKNFNIEKKIENFEENNYLKLVSLKSIHAKDTVIKNYLIKKEIENK